MSEPAQEQTTGGDTAGTVGLHTDETAGTVAIGATIDGVFVPFYTLPKTQVDGLVASGKAAQENAAAAPAGS